MEERSEAEADAVVPVDVRVDGGRERGAGGGGGGARRVVVDEDEEDETEDVACIFGDAGAERAEGGEDMGVRGGG